MFKSKDLLFLLFNFWDTIHTSPNFGISSNIMYLLIEVGSGGRENNWPSVMVALTSLCSFHVPWPWRKYFPVQRVVQSHGLTKPPVGRSYFVFAVQPYHSVNKYMTLEKGSFQGSLTVHWYYNHHKFKLYYGCCFFWKL